MGLLARLFKALNSDASPWQLAWGIMLGMIMGLTPLLGIHTIIIIFFVLFLRINISSFLVAWAVFATFSIALSSSMASIGGYLLTEPSLQSLWTSLYNSTLGQLTQFYHTLTLGSLVLSFILAPVVLILSKVLIVQYRARLMVWINKLKLVQFIKGTSLFQLYQALGE